MIVRRDPFGPPPVQPELRPKSRVSIYRTFRIDLRGDSNRGAQSLHNAGFVSRIAILLIANEQAVGILHLALCAAGGYGELELTGLEIAGSQIPGAIASTLLLQSELKRVRHWRTLFSC